MAYLHEDLEKVVDESMPFLFEKLGDLSQLKKHQCFTLAQCAILLCMHNNIEKPDRTEDAATFFMLALKDVAYGKLQVLHPETLLPWSEYLEMIKAGMYGNANELQAPMVTAGWLVPLEECEKWYRSKNLSIGLLEVKADIEKLNSDIASVIKSTTGENAPAIKGITKREVMNAFAELHYDYTHWGRNLASQPKWLEECCVARGNKTTSGLWNPVQIAIALTDKGVALRKLDNVFATNLKDWANEWNEKSEYLR